MKYKDFPFEEVASAAEKLATDGFYVHQKWTCDHCGSRQTMPDANVFYRAGICEECKKETNIAERGCNYLVTTMRL